MEQSQSAQLPGLTKPAVYRIVVGGALSPRWRDRFTGLLIEIEEAPSGDSISGDCVTCLTGVIPDQAALLGVLQQIYTLGLPLLEVTFIQKA